MNPTFRSESDSRLEPGEVVWVNVLNPQENRGCRGKFRPAILLHRRGNGWRVMGLTRNDFFRDGTPRTPIHDPAALGLCGRSFLWGRPTDVSALDIGGHIGWVDEPTAATLAQHPIVHVTAATLLGREGDTELTIVA